MKDLSYSMTERQQARKHGKYIKMFICENCNKPIGASYFSLPDCDITGKGLILCKQCCKKLELIKNNIYQKSNI
jgi:transcription elongation factor Elf1